METAKGETKEVVDPISEHEPSNKDTLTLQVWSRFDGAQISDVYRVCVMPTSPTVVSKENGHGSTFVEVHDIDVVLLRGLKIEEEEQSTLGQRQWPIIFQQLQKAMVNKVFLGSRGKIH